MVSGEIKKKHPLKVFYLNQRVPHSILFLYVSLTHFGP